MKIFKTEINQSSFFLKLIYFLMLVISINIIEINHIFKGVFFIFCSLSIIYLNQKILNYKKIILLLICLSIPLLANYQNLIEEKSAVLKINPSTSDFYTDLFGIKIYSKISDIYKKKYPNCYDNIKECFKYEKLEKFTFSPDQNILNFDKSLSRKVNRVNFDSISDLRPGFISTKNAYLKYGNKFFTKQNTPYYINYSSIRNISKVCYKGLIYIKKEKLEEYNSNDHKCINLDNNTKDIQIYGFQIDELLSIKLIPNSYIYEILNYVFFLILAIFFASSVSLRDIKFNLKLYIPVLLTTLISFTAPLLDVNSWFTFNLFSFYFYQFEGGDGLVYITFMHEMYSSLVNLDFKNFFRAGENSFYYTPGIRFFLVIEKILFGDYYYLLFFFIFFVPKLIYKFFNIYFNNKITYLIFLLFVSIPLLHHIGFSYLQYIRYSYRILSEPIGYAFFLLGFIQYLINYNKNIIKCNFFFLIAVFIRPSLLITVFFLILFKFYEHVKYNNYKKYFPLYFIISLLYLLPLAHNYYYGNSFTLITDYGSNILSLDNIYSKDHDFYFNKLTSITTLFLVISLSIPIKNLYIKTIILSQYLTLFYFDENLRYFWLYWIMVIQITLFYIIKLYSNRKKINE
jgi:hypothetical protein